MKVEMILELNEQPKRLKKNLKKKQQQQQNKEKQIQQNRPKLRRMTKDTEKIEWPREAANLLCVSKVKGIFSATAKKDC